jgi:hypothetical protein
MSWDDLTRLSQDCCAQALDEAQSQMPGQYRINDHFRWCESLDQYSNLMSEPTHFYKQYRNACRIDDDSRLRYADLTNRREIYQLKTRPYSTVPYMGVGSRSLNNKDVESELTMGLNTQLVKKACQPTSGVSIDRFWSLPDYGNPQRVQHTVEPWIRGGENTRDYVRRVNYERQCLNKKNAQVINEISYPFETRPDPTKTKYKRPIKKQNLTDI